MMVCVGLPVCLFSTKINKEEGGNKVVDDGAGGEVRVSRGDSGCYVCGKRVGL